MFLLFSFCKKKATSVSHQLTYLAETLIFLSVDVKCETELLDDFWYFRHLFFIFVSFHPPELSYNSQEILVNGNLMEP